MHYVLAKTLTCSIVLGNIGLRLPNALQMLQYLDAHVLLVEYRGYGDSDDAQVNEAGLKLDAEAALRFIRTHPHVDPNQIFLFGRSLGGGVAFHLAQYAEKNSIPVAGVMVENTFLSIAAMVDTLMPYVAPFKALILRIGWRSDRIVPHLTVPVLYLAGARDELVRSRNRLGRRENPLFLNSSSNSGATHTHVGALQNVDEV